MVLVGDSFLARLVGRFLTLLVRKPKPFLVTDNASVSEYSFGNRYAVNAAELDSAVSDCSKDFCSRMASPVDFATVEIIVTGGTTKDSLKFPHSWSAVKFPITPPIEDLRPLVFDTERKDSQELDRALSERLAVVASMNGPKALRVHTAAMRSTMARPAPVIETRLVRKTRHIGPITWPAYTGRTHSQSRRNCVAMSQSAQIIPLSKKAMPVKRSCMALRSPRRGLARAA